MTRALMIQGTASHVGKTVLTAAFARWLAGQGSRVAPFKAQNMSLNSHVTLQGEEIARSQAAQAEALGLEPTAAMNPILLKPLRRGCQVIVQGKSAGVMTIHEYYAYKPQAWRAITESYDQLANQFDWIVLEGAGSPAEINLRDHDLVNMRMAEHANAKVIIVADIERGGCFAQMIGTWELLRADERRRVIGFLINKFQGDASLLTSGLDYVRERTGRPVFGVLPMTKEIDFDEEDSLGLPRRAGGVNPPVPSSPELEITILRLPGLSNFTDFAPLARLPGIRVHYATRPDQLDHADLIILPGTRTTIYALRWLMETGLADTIRTLAVHAHGPLILGVCGGLQLLGNAVRDPGRVESESAECSGLGVFDMDTEFAPEKTLRRVTGEVIAPGSLAYGAPVIGYEVHHGVSRQGNGVSPWLRLTRQPGGEIVEDGAVHPSGRIFGTYVHGLFDDERFRRAVTAELYRRRRLPPPDESVWRENRRQTAHRHQSLDAWLEANADLATVAAALR